MPTSGVGAQAASSLASAIVCGKRPRTAAFSLTPRRKFSPPISPGFMLDCALWGVADASKLAFLDAPPRGALMEAQALLTRIGAVDGDGRITDEGRAIASLALPPRLARMVVDAARAGEGGICERNSGLADRTGAWRRFGRSLDPDRGFPPRPLATGRRRKTPRARTRGAGGGLCPRWERGARPSPPGRRRPGGPDEGFA